MKKIVFYPLLFSIDPLLLLLVGNLSDIPTRKLFPFILVIPLCTAWLFWSLNRWLRDIYQAGFVTFLITFWFFDYGTVHLFANILNSGSIPWGSHWVLLPLWTAVLAFLASGWVWKKITSPQTITLFLNLVCLLITGYTVFRISMDAVARFVYDPGAAQDDRASIGFSSTVDSPDIYYIILDGYARADVLQELYHYDNSAFLEALSDRGFFISAESQSNYVQTPLSLASSLNMSYLDGLPRSNHERGLLMGMIRNSKVRELLHAAGYKLVALSSGYQLTELTDADYYFSSPHLGKTNDLEGLLLNNSVAVVLVEQGWLDIPITHYGQAQERIRYTFASLTNEIPTIDGPKFVFAHLIAPHPPFIFNQDQPVDPGRFYILVEGGSFTGGSKMYIRDYLGQLTFVNQQIIQTIDGILANSARPPIIILQGDHGPGAYLDMQSVENTCLRERFSILNAYYLPGGAYHDIPGDITPVNTFAMILNAYFGSQIQLLENKQYFSTWNKPFAFIDVSNKSQLPCDIR